MRQWPDPGVCRAVTPHEERVSRRRLDTPPSAAAMSDALPPWLEPAIMCMVAIHAAMDGGQPPSLPRRPRWLAAPGARGMDSAWGAGQRGRVVERPRYAAS